MPLNKLAIQKRELRKMEKEAMESLVETEFKARLAERFLNGVSYNSKKKSEREDQLALLQIQVKESKIQLEMIADIRKDLGIVEMEESADDDVKKNPVTGEDFADEDIDADETVNTEVKAEGEVAPAEEKMAS